MKTSDFISSPCCRLPMLIGALLLCFTAAIGQVKLNEVMVRPGGNQGLVVFNGNSGNEYVELYNPSCSPVDVAGYFIACRQDFAGTVSGGAFRIPNVSAAVIPPGGHLVLGTATSSADANSVDIKLPSYTSNYCFNNPAYNFILANADGWVALYNATGTPVDAIYWSASAANISQTADFGGVPCVPTGSPGGTVLKSAQQINATVPGVLSYGGANPSAGLTFSRIPDGGSWQGGISPSINDLTVGNCNGGTCATIATLTIAATTTNPTCGNSNGSITITVSQGTGPYTYAWAGGATGATRNGLAAGNYAVTVTDNANGCQANTSVSLTSPGGPTLNSVTATAETCLGSNNGTATASASGGTAPLAYSWNTVPPQNLPTATGLSPGSYSVTVTDGANCQTTGSVTVAAGPLCCNLLLSSTTTNPTCGNSNGSITITVSQGTGPYTYAWAGGATGATRNGLAAGSYAVTVTDNANGCQADTSVSLTSPGGPTLNSVTATAETCLGSNNGTATASASGGTAPLAYNWNTVPPQNLPTATGLPPGNYSVTVTDGANCQTTGSVTVAAGPVCCNLLLSSTTTNPTCGNSNGSITITVSQGTGPYTYAWAGGATGATRNGLAAGSYAVTVTDNGQPNCQRDTTIILNDLGAPIIDSLVATDETCLGAGDGSVTVYINNGLGSNFVTWSVPSAGNPTSIGTLTPGIYSVTVTDANGCNTTGQVAVNAGPVCCNLSATASTNPATCNNADGTITVTVNATSGLAPFGFSINNAPAVSSGIFTNLAAGNYTVVVFDANLCTDTLLVAVTEANNTLAINLASTNPTCFNGNNGSVVANVSGGIAPLTLLWSTGGNNPAISNLAAGPYSITVTDANNCTASALSTLQNPAPLLLDLGNDITLCNDSTATINAGVWANYNWSTGDTSASIAVNTSGVFGLTITDALGCNATDSIEVTVGLPILVNAGLDTALVLNENSIILSPVVNTTGGSFAWSPATGLNCSDCANPVAAPDVTTTYLLTYTDALGCLGTDSIKVTVIEGKYIALVPNAFSPNNDGLNDFLFVYHQGVRAVLLRIFDRWGEKVFETTDLNQGWDGTYKGVKLSTGTFVWHLYVEFNNLTSERKTGSVVLLK